MDKLYKVAKIEGKDLGCVAIKDIKKGTLILQEAPQCIPTINDMKSVITSYLQMDQGNQEEFMKLCNRFRDYDSLDEYGKARQDYLKQWIVTNQEFLKSSKLPDEKVLEIFGIYSTNAFLKGVGIQTSRFNHSCCSNAETIWDEDDQLRNTRAVSKINAGEEITINYHWEGLSMKDLDTRQELLLSKWGFKCCCQVCKDEEKHQETAIYKSFEQLQLNVKECITNQRKPDSAGRLENIKKEVTCHKQMYKLAKDKKAPRTFIVNEILDDGFNAAVQGYLLAESVNDRKIMEEFKKECEILALAGEQLSKVLSKATINEWIARKHHFKDWIQLVKKEMKEQQYQFSNLPEQ